MKGRIIMGIIGFTKDLINDAHRRHRRREIKRVAEDISATFDSVAEALDSSAKLGNKLGSITNSALNAAERRGWISREESYDEPYSDEPDDDFVTIGGKTYMRDRRDPSVFHPCEDGEYEDDDEEEDYTPPPRRNNYRKETKNAHNARRR